MPNQDFLSSCLEHPSTRHMTFHSAYSETLPEHDETFDDTAQDVRKRHEGHVHKLAELTLLQLQNEYAEENVRKIESHDGREVVIFVRSSCLDPGTTVIAS